MSLYTETTSMLQKVFETRNEVIIVPIPGKLAVEMAAVNLVARGNEALVCINGIFSADIVDAIRALGGRAVPITSEFGKGPTLDQVKAAVDGLKDPAGRTIFLVQNETSTGAAVNPGEIFRYCKKKGMITVLDAISAIGGMEHQVRPLERRLCDRLFQQGSGWGQRCLSCGDFEGSLGHSGEEEGQDSQPIPGPQLVAGGHRRRFVLGPPAPDIDAHIVDSRPQEGGLDGA